MFTKQQIESAARFSNFCQLMKMRLWSKAQDMGGYHRIPVEAELDEIALELFHKYVEPLNTNQWKNQEDSTS